LPVSHPNSIPSRPPTIMGSRNFPQHQALGTVGPSRDNYKLF
jgi:hypothetical protein